MLRLLLSLCAPLILLTPASAAPPAAHGPYVKACRAAAVRSHIAGADAPAHELGAKRSGNGNIWVFVGDIACEFRDAPLPHLVSLQTSGCYECNYSLGPDTIDRLNRLFDTSPVRTCWTVGRDDDWSLCFGDHGEVLAATFSALSGEGRSTGGRYRGTGNQITFEITPDMFDETWPWQWTKVTCTLGGPKGVMALTDCLGSGQHWPHKSSLSHEPLADLTLTRSTE
jgi:hypothetical protein